MSQRQQLCMIVTHGDFKNDDETLIHLHAVKSHWQIDKEGDPDLFFEEPQAENPNPQQDVQILLPSVLFDRDTIDMARIESLQGMVDIDDDNGPAPEIIPDATRNANPSCLLDVWIHSGICFRRQQNNGFPKACITFSVGPTEDNLYLQLFEGLFPTNYLETVLLEETNQSIEGEPVTYGELLRWIGLWIIMSTCDGSDCHSFWSNKNPYIFDGHHFCLQQLMSRYRFEGILCHHIHKQQSSSLQRQVLGGAPVVGILEQQHGNKFYPIMDKCD